MATAVGHSRRFRTLAAVPGPRVAQQRRARRCSVSDPVIRTQGLTKFYGKSRGIVGLDLDVAAGEIFGYLGPNGAGKTTTIRLLLDLIRPTEGRADVFGLDSHRGGLSIRHRVGFLPGELRLYGSVSAQELFSYFGHLRHRFDPADTARIAEALDLDTSREIRQLSHGNRQKVGLVQALMGRPELVILDEPTQGLDPFVQQAFYRLLDEVRAEGRTVFMSSHVLPEIERTCDRVAIVREGRLLAVERVDDLKARALRRLELRFDAPVPADAFADVAEVRDVVVDGSVVTCAVVGKVAGLFRAASAFTLVDVLSSEPSLEEIFLAYYGDADDAAA
jgi:ABC-2 type transport system ATP-binding protein